MRKLCKGCHLEDMWLNVKRKPREVDYGDDIELVQDHVHWEAFMLSVLNLQIILKESFLLCS
jgi:hypothetical protein